MSTFLRPISAAIVANCIFHGVAFSQAPISPVVVVKPSSRTVKVVGVVDGDTLSVITDVTVIKVRLKGIDAPESHQDFGTQAKKALSDKVFGKKVVLVGDEKDRYGRLLADVYADGRWINWELVKEGWAWHYLAYSNDEKLTAAEMVARSNRTGVWSHPEPVSPWDFRSREAEARKEAQKQKEVAATREIAKVTKSVAKPTPKPTPKPVYQPTGHVAENGDVRGADNDGDGRAETEYVRGYFRKNGTYVRGHYRAKRR